MSWFSKNFGAIGGILGSIGSSIIGSNSAKSVSEQNYETSRESMQYRHQWEVEDLKKAGLNPILSATGSTGTTSGTGVSYSPENPLANLLAYEKVKSDIKLQNANIDAIKQQMAHNALFFKEDLQQRKYGTAKALLDLEYFPKMRNLEIDNINSSISARNAESAPYRALEPVYDLGGQILQNTAKAYYGDGYNSDGSVMSSKDYAKDKYGANYEFYGD